MPRQVSPLIENSFVKGLVTSSTGFTFPQNAVTETDNTVFDFLGQAIRREGFNLEVGNVPKQANYSGSAISSYVWHNVLGDGTLNIYVVQVGNLLYFYPLSTTGGALSAQLVSNPLDFTTLASAANINTFIAANASPVVGHIGDMTTGGGVAAAFDNVTLQATAVSANKITSGGTAFSATPTASPTGPYKSYIGQDYHASGGGTPQKIGTVVVTMSSDYGISDGGGLRNFTMWYGPNAGGPGVPIRHIDQIVYRTTLKLWGKTGNTGPANAEDGTLLATAVYSGGTSVTLTSSDTSTAFSWVWVEAVIDNIVSNPNGYSGATYFQEAWNITPGIAEVQLYSPTVVVTAASLAPYECQYASGLGYLFVTHPFCLPFAVTYTAGSPATYTATAITISVRDFDGVNDTYQSGTSTSKNITTRPTDAALAGPPDMTNYHLYNLYNQGWNASLITTFRASFASTYPSNCDVWWQMKNSSGVFSPGTIGSPVNTSYVDQGSATAPKGRFIYDAFYIDRGTNIPAGAGAVGVIKSNYNRPSTVAFHAGRVWYSGVNYPQYANSVWFTQTISPTSATIVETLGHCYQAEDPTSETLFDLLPNDGGVVQIQDCGQIYKLFPMQNAMLVFASNGIWAITGSKGTSGLGFVANDYTVTKVSSVKQISGTSFVDVLGMPFWWNNEGIYTIKVDQNSGGLQVENITYSTIGPTYDDILRNSKQYARGAYNPIDYTIQWLYRSTAPTTTPDDNYKYDRVMVYNTITNAFYTFSVSNTNVHLASICVTDTGGETDVSPTNVTFTFKYFVTYNNVSLVPFLNIADNFDTRYVDWYSYDNAGVSYNSEFTSGFKLQGKGQSRFISNYVYVYSDNTVNTAYKIQGIRDYGLVGNSGVTSTVQVTNNTSYFGNVIKRHRIRGRGIVQQFKIQSYSTLPFHILGWSVQELVNSSP